MENYGHNPCKKYIKGLVLKGQKGWVVIEK